MDLTSRSEIRRMISPAKQEESPNTQKQNMLITYIRRTPLLTGEAPSTTLCFRIFRHLESVDIIVDASSVQATFFDSRFQNLPRKLIDLYLGQSPLQPVSILAETFTESLT